MRALAVKLGSVVLSEEWEDVKSFSFNVMIYGPLFKESYFCTYVIDQYFK